MTPANIKLKGSGGNYRKSQLREKTRVISGLALSARDLSSSTRPVSQTWGGVSSPSYNGSRESDLPK